MRTSIESQQIKLASTINWKNLNKLAINCNSVKFEVSRWHQEMLCNDLNTTGIVIQMLDMYLYII